MDATETMIERQSREAQVVTNRPVCPEASLGLSDAHEPDEMGVWSDDDERVWLPRSRYPNRIDAIRWAMDEWSVSLPEVRCRSRWMRYAPQWCGGWWEDRWQECEKDELDAFRVWRLEAA